MMTTISFTNPDASGVPTMQRIRDWNRVLVATVARGLLMVLLGMAFWAAAPIVLGWEPTTEMTGSMEPRLHSGDVVVSRPMPKPMLHPGQVLLFDDPDQHDRLRMHRYVKPRSDGMMITRGDANPAADSTAITGKAVHGVGFIRVPFVGLPILWMRTGSWFPVLVVALVIAAAGLLSRIDAPLRRGTGGAQRAAGPDDGGGGDDGGDGGDEKDDDDRSGRTRPKGRHRHRRLRPTAAALLGAVVVGGMGLVVPAPAMAVPFLGRTSSPLNRFAPLTATPATALTCTNNADNTVNIGWTYTAVTPMTFTVLTGSTVLASADGTLRSARVTMAQFINFGTTYTVQVRTNLLPDTTSWTATSTSTVKVTVSALGATAVRCA